MQAFRSAGTRTLAAMDEIEARIRTVLLGLLLISEGKTQNLQAQRGGEPDYTPRGQALHTRYSKLIAAARTGEDRMRLIVEAETMLASSKGGALRDRVNVDWKTHILTAYEGWSTADVADSEKCTRMAVWRLREAAGLQGKDGRPKE